MPLQTRETAIQNEVVRLYCQFMKFGTLTNPAAQPMVEIIGSDGATIMDTVPAQLEYDGIWFADWYVPENLPVGTYYDRWTFQWDANSGVEELVMPIQVRSYDNYINFISKGLSHKLSSRVVQLVKDLENFFIYEATHIPVYWEQGMRVQQEDQEKRIKTFYHFAVDADESYSASEGTVYFNNGHKFTVFSNFDVSIFYSSSSSNSTSSSSSELESLSSSSGDSSSSSITESSVTSSSSSGELTSESSPESAGNVTTSSSLTEEDSIPKVILTCVGTGQPLASGTLAKVSGTGSASIGYNGVTSKRSKFSTIYNFTYRNWVRDFKPIVRLNQRIIDDGWYADYDGNIYIDRLMSPRDTIEVCYKFSCFSMEQLLGFLRMGLMMMNSIPPASETFGNLDIMPYEWNGPVLLYAAIQSLRRTLYGMNFQEKRAIYGGAGNDEWAQQASSIFQSLYQDYNSQWNEISSNVKKKLPPIAMYVTPEYTLPGGRSRWFRYLYKSSAG